MTTLINARFSAIPLLVVGLTLVSCNNTSSPRQAVKEASVSSASVSSEAPVAQPSPREAGERYLAENAKKEGVRVTASGLQYEVLQEGTGRRPSATDVVQCHYEGRFVSGQAFDGSYKHGNGPATFSLQRVIAGWTEGLQLMREGAKYRFVIPPHLAYGAEGMPGAIPPFSTLVFDIELVRIQ